MRNRFYSIYSHGIIRAAVCLPSLRVADPSFNLERTLALARQASEAGVAVALFPELGLSAYTNDDLFHQDALLDASKAAVAQLVKASAGLASVLVAAPPMAEMALAMTLKMLVFGWTLIVSPPSGVPVTVSDRPSKLIGVPEVKAVVAPTTGAAGGGKFCVTVYCSAPVTGAVLNWIW